MSGGLGGFHEKLTLALVLGYKEDLDRLSEELVFKVEVVS